MPDSRGHLKRISRIRRRACVEVRQAYEQGCISARCADTLLYLPVEQKRAELERILSAQEEVQRQSQIAVGVIRKHLADGRHDLNKLRADLELALNG